MQKRPPSNAISVTPPRRRSRHSVHPAQRPASQPRSLAPPPTTTPAVTTSTTTPAATPAPPNTAPGEGNSSSVTTLHDHCLCSVGGSCDICCTAHPVALATKAEVDSLLQRVLDLEVCLKTENKSLRLQVLALEERNDHLENEIAMLRSNTSTKAKPASTNNKGRYKGAPPKKRVSLLSRRFMSPCHMTH